MLKNWLTQKLTYWLNSWLHVSSFGIDGGHLLTASVMSAPAALAFAKLFYPETKKSKTTADNLIFPASEYVSWPSPLPPPAGADPVLQYIYIQPVKNLWEQEFLSDQHHMSAENCTAQTEQCKKKLHFLKMNIL